MDYKKEEEKLKKSLAKLIIPSLVNEMHNVGLITDSDLLDRNIVSSKLKKYIDIHGSSIFKNIVIDHRDTILRIAEQQNNEGHTELAVALYATCVEHTLNNIVQVECIKKKYDAKTNLDILRNVNLSGKCSWLFKLLGLPALKEEHIKTILNIADERNSYFHYKWKPDPDSNKIIDLKKRDEIHIEKINKIKSLIKYLKRYETQQQFQGKKKKIVRASL